VPPVKGQKPVTWVLEAEVFPSSHDVMRHAVHAERHEVVAWTDEWWVTGRWPRFADRVAIFHGSLGNAARIRGELPWSPGAYCETASFHCTAWYPRAQPWLLHREWFSLPAASLVAEVETALKRLGQPESVFVRPDSPLKPFSGRVLKRDAITLKALDHGFYYEDDQLPVLVAPVRAVAREWRYVVVDRQVVAGSAYAADSRSKLPDDPSGAPWRFAARVAAELEPPESVYVMDVCEADGELRLLELNPFSGADLYACNRGDVVKAVSLAASR
jgi:hypothetical protein